MATGKTGLELILADCEEELANLHKIRCLLTPRGRSALKFYTKLAASVRKEIVRQDKLPEKQL